VITAIIAKRYALSLVQLGAEEDQVDTFRRELTHIGDLFSSTPEIPAAFADPAVSHNRKKDLMGNLIAACGCTGLISNFLQLLVDKNRTALLSQIIQAFHTLADEHSGILRPDITTAFALDDTQLAKVRNALEQTSTKHIIPRVTVDSTLLGGIVVQIGDTVYDSSVKTQLSRIQEQLQKG